MAWAIWAAASSSSNRYHFFHFLDLQQLWWYLALLSVVSLLGQEIARTTTIFASAAELEGFSDDVDEPEEDASDFHVVIPPLARGRPGFETDRGPPPVQVEEPSVSNPDDSSPGLNLEAKSSNSKHDIWDEDEFEGLPQEVEEKKRVEEKTSSDKQDQETNTGTAKGSQSYYVEIFSVLFLISYAVNYYFGRKENERIALAWATQFATKDSIFEKNFSLLGTGDGEDAALLMKEGQNVFKFYASGRRFCQGLLATLDLKNRHDLISCIWNYLSPSKDELNIEVFMNSENMDPMVMALTRKKNAKSMHKEWRDLQQYTTILPPSPQRKWSEELTVISESRDLVNDLFTDAVLDQVFGDKAFEKYGSHFVSLHFTDQNPSGGHRKVLLFKFTLPSPHRMAEIARLITLVPYFIDSVAHCKLAPQAKLKAETARAKVAQEALKESPVRQDVLKKRDERQIDSKISSEAMRKKEEKERLRQLKKAMPKVKMTRVH